MGQRFPVCSASEVIQVLRRHVDGRQVIVAMHGKKSIPIGTLKSIIEGSGIPVEAFR